MKCTPLYNKMMMSTHLDESVWIVFKCNGFSKTQDYTRAIPSIFTIPYLVQHFLVS